MPAMLLLAAFVLYFLYYFVSWKYIDQLRGLS